MAELRSENDAMRAQWEGEKKAIALVKENKQRIEDVKLEVAVLEDGQNLSRKLGFCTSSMRN